MGQTTDELRQAVDETRENATQKIQEIEQMVGEKTEMVKQSLDWRTRVNDQPMMALGIALAGGFLLGGVVGGKDHDSGTAGNSIKYNTANANHSEGGLVAAIKKAVADTGLEESISQMASGYVSDLGQKARDMVEQALPMLSKSGQDGGSQSTSQASQLTQGARVSSSSFSDDREIGATSRTGSTWGSATRSATNDVSDMTN